MQNRRRAGLGLQRAHHERLHQPHVGKRHPVEERKMRRQHVEFRALDIVEVRNERPIDDVEHRLRQAEQRQILRRPRRTPAGAMGQKFERQIAFFAHAHQSERPVHARIRAGS